MATKAAEVIDLEPVSVSLERMGCTIDCNVRHDAGYANAWVTLPGRFFPGASGFANSTDPELAIEDAVQRFMRRFNDRAQGKPR